MTKAELEKKMKEEILSVVVAALAEHFDLDPEKQIEYISANEITLPLVDEEGNEKWPTLKVASPRGKRDGNGGYIPFDGHAAAEDYRFDLAEKAVKKEKAEAKKAADIARREAKKAKKEDAE